MARYGPESRPRSEEDGGQPLNCSPGEDRLNYRRLYRHAAQRRPFRRANACVRPVFRARANALNVTNARCGLSPLRRAHGPPSMTRAELARTSAFIGTISPVMVPSSARYGIGPVLVVHNHGDCRFRPTLPTSAFFPRSRQ